MLVTIQDLLHSRPGSFNIIKHLRQKKSLLNNSQQKLRLRIAAEIAPKNAPKNRFIHSSYKSKNPVTPLLRDSWLVTHEGFEPSTPWLKVRCSTNWASGSNMAGVVGFEPANAGVKVPCLTPWLHPNVIACATAQKWGGIWDSNPWPPGPQPGTLTNWANPTIHAFFAARWLL